MTKRQLEKVRAKFENLDLSRYHILTYDGTEVTITQGDIDWAQDYCDAHGIDWSRSGEEEAKANDGAKEGGQAASAENQAELENYDSADETNDNYSTEKAEELKAEEENLQAASNGKENASVSAESNKASRSESKENSAVRSEKAEHNLVDKFVGGAKNIFFDFFGFGRKTKDEAKIYVTNQTDVTILIRPESRDDPYTLLKAGDSYKGKIDGVIFLDGTVFKTNGNSKYANYATGSAPFLEDWLNSNKVVGIDNNNAEVTSFVPIPRNLDGSVPPASFTLSRWNEFLK